MTSPRHTPHTHLAVVVLISSILAAGCNRPPQSSSGGAADQRAEPSAVATTVAAAEPGELAAALEAGLAWSTASGLYLHGRCPLATADVDPVELGKRGVTTEGVFYAAPEQPEPAPPHVRLMLGNLELAEGVLRRATVTEVKSLETDHVIFKARVALDPVDARWLGLDTLRVAIKPATSGTYGKEYRRELAFYRLGRALEAAGLIPIVERHVALSPQVEAQVDEVLTADQRARLSRETDEAGRTTLRGSMQLWVEGYGPYIGHRKSANRVLNWTARALHDGVGHRKPAPSSADGDRPARSGKPVAVTGDPMWQALSDMFVLDFLVYNSDRSMEAGTVRLPDGGQALVMLDNGDTLMLALHKGTDTSREHFESAELFSPNVVAALDTLDEDALAALLVDMEGKPLVNAKGLTRLAARVKEARKRIARLERAAEPDGTVRFEHASRARGHLCR